MTDVRDVMNGPVLTVEPDASAADAAQLMRDNDTGDVVITQDGRLTGIVTDRDLAVRLIAEGLDPFVSVSEVCSENPVTISPDEPLERASELMGQHAIRRLPVCEGDEVVGFVSLGDLARHVNADQTLSNISSAAPNA